MRTDKKINNDAIIVSYSGEANNLFIRHQGSDNKDKLRTLLSVEKNQIKINNQAMQEFGLSISPQTQLEKYDTPEKIQDYKPAKESKSGVLRKNYDIAMVQRPLDEGLTKSELMDLCDMMEGQLIPIEIQGENAAAMGFISADAADIMDYKYGQDSLFGQFIQEILDDMDKEHDLGLYDLTMNGHTFGVYLGYDAEREMDDPERE